MTYSFFGKVQQKFFLYQGIPDAFFRKTEEWQKKAVAITGGKIGYCPGTIVHYFHGTKEDRQLISREQMLIKHLFDPDKDLTKDEQGL